MAETNRHWRSHRKNYWESRTKLLSSDIISTNGSLQICTGIRPGHEIAIHVCWFLWRWIKSGNSPYRCIKCSQRYKHRLTYYLNWAFCIQNSLLMYKIVITHLWGCFFQVEKQCNFLKVTHHWRKTCWDVYVCYRNVSFTASEWKVDKINKTKQNKMFSLCRWFHRCW